MTIMTILAVVAVPLKIYQISYEDNAKTLSLYVSRSFGNDDAKLVIILVLPQPQGQKRKNIHKT